MLVKKIRVYFFLPRFINLSLGFLQPLNHYVNIGNAKNQI